MTDPTYELVEGPGIKCLKCGLTSFHPADVSNLYCGNCHAFHYMNLEPPLPTHCFDCGVILMGGATKHKDDCGILAIIRQHFPDWTPG